MSFTVIVKDKKGNLIRKVSYTDSYDAEQYFAMVKNQFKSFNVSFKSSVGKKKGA